MIVADRFVFLHLHKSGGSFVNEFLLSVVPGAVRVGYHLPWHMAPATHAAVPALGLVRNPWSYYVSWYAFQSQLPRPNALFGVLSRGGALDFAATLRNMLALGSESDLLDDVVAALPAAYTHQGLNLPGPVLAAIRDSGLGFYSFLYRYLYAGDGILHVGRMEHVRVELPRMLAAVGQPLVDGVRQQLLSRERLNVSRHAGYTQYYDATSRDLVARHDGELIERHGYRFGPRRA